MPGCGWCRRRRSGAARRSSSCSRRTSPPGPRPTSIAVQKLMALQLTDKAAMETPAGAAVAGAAAGAAARHPAGFAERAGDGAAAVLATFRRPAAAGDRRGGGAHPLDPVARPGLAGASNAFAAMGRRTAGGAPLLATDPHLGLSAPSIWMLARMDLAEGPVMGATIPGIPAVHRRAQRRSRLGADRELSRRPGPLYREAEPRRAGRISDADGLREAPDARCDHRGAGRRAGAFRAALDPARAGGAGRQFRRRRRSPRRGMWRRWPGRR